MAGYEQFPDKSVGFPVGLMLSAGQIDGFTPLNKFGNVVVAGAGQVVCWTGGGGTYNWIAETGTQLYHSSSSVNDNGKVIVHHLLDASDWTEKTVYATCLGTTVGTIWSSGTTPGTYVRNWRKYNIGLGTRFNDHLVGTHYTYWGSNNNGVPVGASHITSYIMPGTYNNQTQMAVWSIPGDEELILMGYYTSLLRASGVSALAMDIDLVVARPGQPFRSVEPQGVVNLAGNPFVRHFKVPIEITSKSDLALLVNPGAAASVTGGFFGWRVKV